jgi:hypothetical protein
MRKDTRKPECRLTAFGEVVLRFPFSEALVDDLKDGIPYRFRTYEPRSKEWTVESTYADLAVRLLLRHFPAAEVPARWRYRAPWEEPPPWSESPTAARSSDHYRILHLLPTAPVELIESAYRTLARLHHPDRGGDELAMQRINGAYDALKARVGA